MLDKPTIESSNPQKGDLSFKVELNEIERPCGHDKLILGGLS
jgi:hypothetical protein